MAQDKKPASKKNVDKAHMRASEEMFRQLFGDGVEVDEVVQISFDDEELAGKNKNENVLTIRPKEFLKTGDPISSDIVQGFQNGKAVYEETPALGMEPLVTRVSFTYKNVGIFAPKDEDDKGFTSLDKEVHDAVVSLYAAGNTVFSPAMVYRTMTGRSETTFVPPEKIQEITASIYKCMSSLITIDASEEADIYGLETMYSQNLIYAKAVTLKTKGWTVNAFMLIDEPVLYKYAKLKRQIYSVPLRVLDSPPNKTNDVIVLQGYLLGSVESLRRRDPGQEGEVLYGVLYKLLDAQDATKQKLLRIRNSVKSILNYWIDIGYIDGFEETTVGRGTKYSILLQVSPDEYPVQAQIEEAAE